MVAQRLAQLRTHDGSSLAPGSPPTARRRLTLKWLHSSASAWLSELLLYTSATAWVMRPPLPPCRGPWHRLRRRGSAAERPRGPQGVLLKHGEAVLAARAMPGQGICPVLRWPPALFGCGASSRHPPKWCANSLASPAGGFIQPA